MTYTPTTWTDEVPASSPVKYTIRNSGGTIIYDDVQIDVKTTITTPGTSVNAANLNHIEQGIQTLENATPPKVFTAKGDLFAATGNGAGSRLAVGSNYQQLIANNAQASGLQWVDGVPGIFTAKGDLVVASGADAAAILAIGNSQAVLEVDTNQGNYIKWVNPVVAYCTRASTQSISNGTTTIVDYSTKTTDPYSAVTTGSGWKFTVPVSGYYIISATACFESTSNWADGEVAYLDVYVNNGLFARIDRKDNYPAGASKAMFLSGTCLAGLASNAYVDIRVNQSSGGSLNLVGDGTHNHVLIARV